MCIRDSIYTEVLAASIRDVAKVTLAFWNGAHICTLPPKVFHKMYDHVLTDAGLKIFDEDNKSTFSLAERVGGDMDALDFDYPPLDKNGESVYNFTDDGFTYTIDTGEDGTGFIP